MNDQMMLKYAHLLLEVGLNTQPQGCLAVLVDVSCVHFLPVLTQAFLQRGGRDIDYFVDVPEVQNLQIAVDADVNYTASKAHFLQTATELKHPMLWVHPMVVPAAAQGKNHQLFAQKHRVFLSDLGNRRMQQGQSWCMAVLPQARGSDADHTGQDFARMLLLDADDPALAWRQHLERLENMRLLLQQLNITSLRFRSPHCDLQVQLHGWSLWKGGTLLNHQGLPFVPNLPTREIYTAPDKSTVHGWIRLSHPLLLRNHVMEDVTFSFQRGKLTEIAGDPGSVQVLKDIVQAYPGADHVGEIALCESMDFKSVKHWNNLLLDENTGCHLALGRAVPYTHQQAHPAFNVSPIHLDLVFGDAEMVVEGHSSVSQNWFPIMQQGKFVFCHPGS